MAPSRREFTAAVAALGIADPVGALADTEVLVADDHRGTGKTGGEDGDRETFTTP